MRWIVGLLAGMGVALGTGEFAPPAEGPVAFRRDKIPLDADTIKELSTQLESLARGLDAATAPSRRGAAQMLALALALDPINTKARDLLREYVEKRHQPAADAVQLETIRSRIASDVAWLETAAAGTDGQALAACLVDVLIISDPTHPFAEALREAGEKGAWDGWIPNISAFEPKVVTKNPTPDDPGLRGGVPATKNEILLSKAVVYTMLWQKDEKDASANWTLALAPLQMTATKVARDVTGERPLSVLIGAPVPPAVAGATTPPKDVFAPMNTALKNLLLKYHKTLPAGYQISITSRELEQSVLAEKRQSISAAAAVLASAAITGCEPEAIIIGRLDETGAFRLPPGFWNQLQSLGKGRGQRLVLPAEAEDYLSGMLTLGKIDFFLEYEVLLASDFKELLDLTSKTPEEKLPLPMKQFREFRLRAGTQNIRDYITKPLALQLLDKVKQGAPCHYSAKLLHQQALGQRAPYVSRKVLASDLRSTLDHMNWIIRIAKIIEEKWKVAYDSNSKPTNVIEGYKVSSLDNAKMGDTYDACRARVDGLKRRYVENKDQDLVESMLKVANALRDLHKGLRTIGSLNIAEVRKACRDLMSRHKELNASLDRVIGEPAQLPLNS